MSASKSLALLCAVTACGGSIPSNQLGPELAKTLCGKYAQCGAAVSQASCLEYLGDFNLSTSYESAIASGKVKYDGAAARSCLDSYAKSSCDGDVFAGTNTDVCRTVYTGQVARGGTCGTGIECARADYCAPSMSGMACSGTCTARIGEGGMLTTSAQCEEDLRPVMGTCQKPAAEGAACSGFSSCADGLYCHSDMTCKKPVGKGQVCDTSTRCSSFYTCTAGVCSELVGVDQSCAAPAGSTSNLSCKLELFCEPTARLCKERGGDGAVCSSSSHCKDPLVCARTGTMPGNCRTPTAEGQSCATVPCDDATYCDSTSRLCVKRIAAGQPCMSGQQCVSNAFCSGGMCTSFDTSCP